jgi:16S rRNA (guanine966-N2)-methyltransferase
MRIIAGKYKIRTLPDPKGFKARPTTDFAKENLFNVLASNYDIDGFDALDLFAGTGSISFELASRGCKSVVAVETQSQHIRYIKSIIEKVNISEVTLLQYDVFKYISRAGAKFNLIFADPPYNEPRLATLPQLVFEHNLLHDGGLLILEHSKNNDFSSHPNFTGKKVYGSVNFSFFEKEIASES